LDACILKEELLQKIERMHFIKELNAPEMMSKASFAECEILYQKERTKKQLLKIKKRRAKLQQLSPNSDTSNLSDIADNAILFLFSIERKLNARFPQIEIWYKKEQHKKQACCDEPILNNNRPIPNDAGPIWF
jgi:hypothetical protein